MDNPRVKVLLIEDDEDDYLIVRNLLSQVTAVRYDLEWASSFDAALGAMTGDHHDVYLLDYYLGERRGLDLLREMNGRHLLVPVILLTGHADYEVDVEAMRAGASDYLVKGQINPPLLERSIRYAIERKRLEQQLRQSQKMEAIGRLAGGIAHDFNNILAAIIGFSELALDNVPSDSKARGQVSRIREAGIRGREVIRQILAFSRKSEPEKKPLPLGLLIEETTELLRASLPSTIDIRLRMTAESDIVVADPGQIQQIIMNMCTNAAHAMKEKGGAIFIELSDFDVSSKAEAPHPRLNPGSYVRLSIKDTGTGMTREILDRVFDPFFTTKKQGEGAGLGLSVALGIVEAHAGAITVESEHGRGSTFAAYLPKFLEAPQQVPETDKAVPTGRERILFIDDEEAIAEMGEELLGSLGYEVVAKTGSNEALELLRKDLYRFDLVISDQTMPDLTGIQLAAEILALRPDMPIILCTGFSHAVDADAARAAGVKAFAMKPMTKTEIARTIRKVLDGQVLPSDGL